MRPSDPVRRFVAVAIFVFALAPGTAFSQPGAGDAGAVILEIDEAVRSKDSEAIADALRAASDVPSPDVVRRIAELSRSSDRQVRSTSIDVLGRLRHPDALEELHALYRKDKEIRTDESLFVTLLRAIARHGEVKSVEILSDSPFDGLTLATGNARILGLANIRAKESVEALIQAQRLSGSGARAGRALPSTPFSPAFRAALTILTGSDRGPTKEEWQSFWREESKTFVVNPERPAVPPFARQAWEAFWHEPFAAATGASPAAAAEPAREPILDPSPDQVDAAVKTLAVALESGDDGEAVDAIASSRLVVDPKVIEAIARGRSSKSAAVQSAALDALGRMPHASALKVLVDSYRKKSIREDELLLPVLLKAIGRHSDPKTIELLADKPLKHLTREVGVARILGLSRIREVESIEVLMKAMTLGGSDRPNAGVRGSSPRFMTEMRLALSVLTGADEGESKEDWLAWWRDAKKKFKISRERPPIDKTLRQTWEEYWEEPYAKQP